MDFQKFVILQGFVPTSIESLCNRGIERSEQNQKIRCFINWHLIFLWFSPILLKQFQLLRANRKIGLFLTKK